MQQLPRGITIRTPTSDITASFLIDLPFHVFEKHLQNVIYRSGYQNWSVANSIAGPSTIDPRVTLYDGAVDGVLYGDGIAKPMEGLEIPERHPSLQISGTVHTTSDAWTPDSSIFTALKSVVPKSFAEANIPRSFTSSPNNQLFTSSFHRQILFSVANNFAGLDSLPIMDLMLLLQRVTKQNLYQLVRCRRTYSSRAIVQNLFKAAIDAGDARIVDVLIRENPKDIAVNDRSYSNQSYSEYDRKYTLLENATMHGYVDLVKVLLGLGADVNKTYRRFGHGHGILDYTVKLFGAGGHHYTVPHPHLFQMLFEAGGDLSHDSLCSLLQSGERELALLFMSDRAGKLSAEWSECGVFCIAMKHLDDHNSMEVASIMVKYRANLNHHAKHSKCSTSSEHYEPVVINNVARRGNLRTFKFLLESGALMTDDTLWCAVTSGNLDLILLLLTEGADINGIGSVGDTPLTAAIRLQDARVLRVIEDHGGFELKREECFTAALMAASEVGNLQVIERLIRLRGKISPQGLGYALIGAIRSEGDEFAKRLIDAGAEVNVRVPSAEDYRGPPLLEALKRRKEALVMSLLDADANLREHYDQESSMVLAVEWGNRSVIDSLILMGANVDGCQNGDQPKTALSIAVKRQDYDLICHLLDSGADINNCEGLAFFVAAENGDIEMVNFLLDQGANPEDTRALAKTMLKDQKLANLIFERYRARYPRRRGDFGTDVLAVAIEMGNEHLIRLMLENGVDANREPKWNYQGVTSFGIAIARQQDNFSGCLELFLKNGCNPNDLVSGLHTVAVGVRVTALLAAIGTQRIATVELFLRYGAEVNFPTRGRIKRTPLQRAAEVGSLELVELLINHGANVNAPAAERSGGTALQLAAIQGYIPIASKLLNFKADINAPASKVNGRTALEGAAEHGRLDMVYFLLSAGAGSRPGDETQIANAIAFARDNWHIPICELLESRLPSRQGSRLELLADNSNGDPTNFNLDDDLFSLVDLEGAG